MSVLMEFSVYPADRGESLSPFVARCVQIVEKSGLPYTLGSMGTTVEAEDVHELLDLVEQCVTDLQKDCHRVEASIRLDWRAGAQSRMEYNLESVEAKLGHKVQT